MKSARDFPLLWGLPAGRRLHLLSSTLRDHLVAGGDHDPNGLTMPQARLPGGLEVDLLPIIIVVTADNDAHQGEKVALDRVPILRNELLRDLVVAVDLNLLDTPDRSIDTIDGNRDPRREIGEPDGEEALPR